jgi:hypothetical protein
MSNVRGMAIFLAGVFLALALTVLVPSTEAQSARSYRDAEPQGQYTLARHRRHHRRYYRRYYRRHHRRHFRHSGAPEQRLHPVGIVTA